MFRDKVFYGLAAPFIWVLVVATSPIWVIYAVADYRHTFYDDCQRRREKAEREAAAMAEREAAGAVH